MTGPAQTPEELRVAALKLAAECDAMASEQHAEANRLAMACPRERWHYDAHDEAQTRAARARRLAREYRALAGDAERLEAATA